MLRLELEEEGAGGGVGEEEHHPQLLRTGASHGSRLHFGDLDPEAACGPNRRLSGRATSFVTVSHIR